MKAHRLQYEESCMCVHVQIDDMIAQLLLRFSSLKRSGAQVVTWQGFRARRHERAEECACIVDQFYMWSRRCAVCVRSVWPYLLV